MQNISKTIQFGNVRFVLAIFRSEKGARGYGILLAEDDSETAQYIAPALALHGLDIDQPATGYEIARRCPRTHRPEFDIFRIYTYHSVQPLEALCIDVATRGA
jgi:hypothetical protein